MDPSHSGTTNASTAKVELESSHSEAGGLYAEELDVTNAASHGSTVHDQKDIHRMGKHQELQVSRRCL